MYVPNWGESVTTGNERIDSEHRQLFEKLDTFMVAVSHNQEHGLVQETLNYLILYCRNHFREEELLHRSAGAPNLEAHMRVHQEIEQELQEILVLYREEGVTPRMEFKLLNGVIRRVIDQIHGYDLPLAQHIQEHSKSLNL